MTIYESGFNQYSPYKYIGNGNAYILDEFSEYKDTLGKDYGQVIIYLKQSVDRYLDNGDYYVSNGSPQQCDFAAERCPDQCGKFPEAIAQGFLTVLTPVGDRAACYSALHPNGSKGYDNLVIKFRK